MTEPPPIKGIDLSPGNIVLGQPGGGDKKKAMTEENKFLKKQNQVLRGELQRLSGRLDLELKKRMQDKKNDGTSRSQDICHMELQNAYKKCQIYKKEADHLKKRLETCADDRLQDFERRITSYAKENSELREEVKQLTKMLKLQEKGLAELGIQGYSRLVADNDQLKEEVRILKKEVDNYRRALERTKTQSSHFENRNDDSAYQRRSPKAKENDSRLEQRLKWKIKTQQNEIGEIQESEDLNDLLQQKVEKDYQKIKTMAKEKSKLRELVNNLKGQLAEKDKENTLLKQKVRQLRTNNQILQSRVTASKSESELLESKTRKDREPIERGKYPRGIRSKAATRQEGSRASKRIWKQDMPAEDEKMFQTDLTKQSHYLRKNESGMVPQNTRKWSDQHLNSKIKEIRVLRHQAGHIQDIHVCYQKGESKRHIKLRSKHHYEVFACHEDGEYIKHIQGGFAEGYLQFLVVTSNYSRVEKYGNYQEYEGTAKGQPFQFEVEEQEYPGALFGYNDEHGIRKLGCFIYKEN